MKKFWKIFGITLSSVLGLILVAAGVVVYVVFTPKHLTPIVNKVAADYLSCDYHIGNVELTFFSTFPEFGLKVEDVTVINPTEGAQSDTVLNAPAVVARIELMALLKEGMIEIHEVSLNDVTANAFVNAAGEANFDVLVLDNDTTPEDTTSESFIKGVRFNDLCMLRMKARQLTYVSEADTLAASLYDATLGLLGQEVNHQVVGTLDVAFPRLSASLAGTDYAADAKVELHAPYKLDLEMEGLSDIRKAVVELEKAYLSLNELKIDVDGIAGVLPSIETDLRLKTNKLRLSEVLALVPADIFTMPEDITAEGKVALEATVVGAYNDSTMPLVDAVLTIQDMTGAYAELPYTLTDVEGEISAHVDLNNETLTAATIRRLSGKTKQSSLSAAGEVTDLMGDMHINMTADLDVNLPDMQYFFPEGVSAKGRAKGPVKVNIDLDDLTDMKLTKGTIAANLNISKLDAKMDDMSVQAKEANLTMRIPSQHKAVSKKEKARAKNLRFMDGCLTLSDLQFEQTGSISAQMGKADIDIQLGDVLSNDPVIYADLDVTTTSLNGKMLMTDSLGQTEEAVVALVKPSLCAYVEYDTKDTLKVPTLDCTFAMNKLDAQMDTIKAHMCGVEGEASISGGRRDKTQPRLLAKLKADDIDANMGKEIAFESGKVDITASAAHTSNKENILLEWQPKLDFHLQKANVNMAALEPTVKIPEITFYYSNKDFHIDTSRIELGQSDFSLSGKIENIGEHIMKKGMLRGTLNFYSSNTNVNELLSYISGYGDDEAEEEVAAVEETTVNNAQPTVFMVPKRVDFTLNTHIQEADAFDQHLSNLGGRAYIKDGVLIIEEMGFICEAAKLQLTAMYKTPRRNHLFVGFDYHMTDIHIEELVNMIPQVDSMLPMLRSFKGAANFHLAAETYLNSRYEIKPSTTRGACSIDAKDLTLLDGETFTKIAKILTFNKKTENKIDSISAEITLYKQQLDIYPFLISCDKWMGAVGGQHNLDMSFDYHVNLLSPLYIGVGVKGTFDDLSIKPEKCIYAKDFRPAFRREVDTQSADIRKMIKKELEKNMK